MLCSKSDSLDATPDRRIVCATGRAPFVHRPFMCQYHIRSYRRKMVQVVQAERAEHRRAATCFLNNVAIRFTRLRTSAPLPGCRRLLEVLQFSDRHRFVGAAYRRQPSNVRPAWLLDRLLQTPLALPTRAVDPPGSHSHIRTII
jgi:hypothetical protein